MGVYLAIIYIKNPIFLVGLSKLEKSSYFNKEMRLIRQNTPKSTQLVKYCRVAVAGAAANVRSLTN